MYRIRQQIFWKRQVVNIICIKPFPPIFKLPQGSHKTMTKFTYFGLYRNQYCNYTTFLQILLLDDGTKCITIIARLHNNNKQPGQEGSLGPSLPFFIRLMIDQSIITLQYVYIIMQYALIVMSKQLIDLDKHYVTNLCKVHGRSLDFGFIQPRLRL